MKQTNKGLTSADRRPRNPPSRTLTQNFAYELLQVCVFRFHVVRKLGRLLEPVRRVMVSSLSAHQVSGLRIDRPQRLQLLRPSFWCLHYRGNPQMSVVAIRMTVKSPVAPNARGGP
jgi:hypothetical protein